MRTNASNVTIVAAGLLIFCPGIHTLFKLEVPPGHGRLLPDFKVEVPESISVTQADAMVEGPGGQLYITNHREGRVIVFDSRGHFLRVIGTSHQSPGQFVYVDRVGWIGDSLWVTDPANKRISVHSADGVLARTIPFPLLAARRQTMELWPDAVLASGNLLIRESWTLRDEPFITSTGVLLLLVSDGGRVLDTLRWLANRQGALVVRLPSRGILQRRQPWSDNDLYGVSPFGKEIVVVERPIPSALDHAQFRVLGFGPTGRLLFEQTIPYHPVTLTENMFDAEVSRSVEVIARSFPTKDKARRAVAMQLSRPRYLPPVRDLLIGPDESIWLNLDQGDNGRTWLILSREGSPIDTIIAPHGAKLMAVSSTGAWGFDVRRADASVPMHYRRVQ